MSTAIDLIRLAEAEGVHLEAEAGEVYASGALTEDMVTRLRPHKADLLVYLTAQHHGLTMADLREAAGRDWPEVEATPALLETLACAVSARRMRERGEVPPSYTSTTICAGCGPVPIFEGARAGDGLSMVLQPRRWPAGAKGKTMNQPEPMVLVPFAGQLLALAPDQFQEAIERGRQIMPTSPAPPSPESDRIVDAAGAAALTGVPATWFESQARCGAIPHLRFGKYLRFNVEEILKAAQARNGKPELAQSVPKLKRVVLGGRQP